uniref:Retrovirus-related Pol polyprotein from transposon TNT 1-94 n=1 Tax=Tanacetum cinerariifolium TaxID=118510 RepID=A0A6L2MC76_TANCI|nr:hypothetical protein [Tanacetum cinerariifolium]
MSNTSEDIQATSSDTCPPMLDRTVYESWIQRATPEGGAILGPKRPRTYDDLDDNDKACLNVDVYATNIVLQGLPKDIYKLINHNIEAKAIWDNVKMLLKGSNLTEEDHESQMYDEFERFKMLLGENINEYYVRFHKLVNDMRHIRMTMPNIQLNSKFVNNITPEWDRFVTAVKLNKGLKETNHEQLYAYLKQHEKHATQEIMIIERLSPPCNDPLAFVSSVKPHTVQGRQKQNQRNNAQGAGATTNEVVHNRARNANQGQARQIKCYNRSGFGHIARNCTQPKRPHNLNLFKDKMLLMQAQKMVQFWMRKSYSFLLADECDAFDSKIDDKPIAQTIFMANMSLVRPAHQQVGPSHASTLSEIEAPFSNFLPCDYGCG